jgi:predicted DNA repair protein MutK
MIAAVIGSITPPGRLRRAVAEALERAEAPSTLIDLAEHPLPFAGAVVGLVIGGIIVAIVRRFTKRPEELIVD